MLDRRTVEADLGQLSRAERRALRELGVRFGEFCLFLPSQLEPEARGIALAFALQAAPDWRPPGEGLAPLPAARLSARALGLRGLMAIGGLAAPVLSLEQLAKALRSEAAGGGVRLTTAARTELGWSEAESNHVLRGLGYAPLRGAAPGEIVTWRRRRPKPTVGTTERATLSPFAALAALQSPPRAARRRRPRRRAIPAAHGG